MKKQLIIAVLFVRIFTNAQVTLNSVSNFSDFNIVGLGNQPITHYTVPYSFVSNGWATYTFNINKTYTSTVVFDSIVAKYDVLAYYQFPAALSVNSASMASGLTTKRVKVTSASSIAFNFNISFSDSSTQINFANLSVIAYAANPVGITNLENAKKSINVYPNPTNNVLNFDELYNVTLKDINGKVLLYQNNQNTLDLSDFQSGVYFLSLENSSQNQTLKVVKL